jgi:hypothetical protein
MRRGLPVLGSLAAAGSTTGRVGDGSKISLSMVWGKSLSNFKSRDGLTSNLTGV